jgi:hypothetical protein
MRLAGAFLVIALCMPAAAMAQQPSMPSAPTGERFSIAHLPPPAPSRVMFAAAAPRPAVSFAQKMAGPLQPPERNWAGRHPALVGAMVGAATGFVVASIPCMKMVCGDSQGPLLAALGTGIGAAAGVTVGVIVSVTR